MARGYKLASGELRDWIEGEDIWEHTTIYKLLGRIYKRGDSNETMESNSNSRNHLDCPGSSGVVSYVSYVADGEGEIGAEFE